MITAAIDRQEMRLVPVVAESGLTLMPLALVYAYVVATFVLFLVWPVDWPIYYAAQWARLAFYVGLCLMAIGWTTIKGSQGAVAVTAPLPGLQPLLIAGAVAASLLLVPSSIAYTGEGPWKALEALGDQGAAYRRFQEQLFTTTGERTVIAASRTAAAPLIYAALPLGILHWRRIGLTGRMAVGVVVANSIVFSIMRGTDKEIADILIVALAATFVAYGRAQMQSPDARAPSLFRYWKPVVIAVLFVLVAQNLFTQRKGERLGGYANRTVVCADNRRICANLDNPFLAWLPLSQRFGLTVFIMSTSQGYYGLALAMEKPFESAYGVGHSPAAMTVYETITSDTALHKRTYTYRNGENRWPEEHYWSTLITWLANDVGFGGAAVLLAGIGFLWGRWWREACAGMSDPAAVLFSLATTAMFYFPANNQVLAGYDGYSILLVWTVLWLWNGNFRRLFMRMPTGRSHSE